MVENKAVYIDFVSSSTSGCVALSMKSVNSIKREYLVQFLFWLFLFILHIIYFLQFSNFNKPYLFVQLGINYLLFILLVNLYYYFLVPDVLRRKWWLFILISVFILGGVPLAKQYADVWLMHLFDQEHMLLYGRKVSFGGLYIMRFTVYSFWAALAVFVRLLVDWFRAERQRMELSNQQLQSELAYLRSQVNPHFLFNTLNNIYALAYKKSEHTAEAVLKLSSMMRYMLYEANEERVALSKEIENLHSFIDLQKLRTRQQEFVNFKIEGDIEHKEIAPLLLIPLVENAFKHGSSIHSAINIQLISQREQLTFRVKNHYSTQQQKDPAGGVGLTNIRRRLELLYPNRHQMEIRKDEVFFEVTLTITE